MKQRKVVSMIGALVLILSAVVLITGCQQANNNKDKAVNKAIYVGKIEQNGTTITNTLTFKADGTCINCAVIENVSVVTMEGTYTGDPSKDGTITVTIKKSLNEEGSLVDYTDEDATSSITISGGKFSVEGMEYTRQ